MARLSAFKQHDLTRALRAANAAGIAVATIEIDPTTGKIIMRTSEPNADNGITDLDKWIRKNASTA